MLGGLFVFVTLFMPKGLAGLFSGWKTAKKEERLDAVPEPAE